MVLDIRLENGLEPHMNLKWLIILFYLFTYETMKSDYTVDFDLGAYLNMQRKQKTRKRENSPQNQ